MNNSLYVKNISISIDGKKILENVDLETSTGDVIAIVGPNGIGKSTFLKSLMKHYSTEVTSGDILFNNKSIINMKTYEIARLGFFYAEQNPVELEGVPMIEFLKNIIKVNDKSSFYSNFKKIDTLFTSLAMDKELLSRSVNVGFSGGQKKKNEILQSQLLKSKILLLDEIDSGLDVDATKIIVDHINRIRQDHIIFIVSHDIAFFEKLEPNKVVLFANGKVAKIGKNEILEEIKKDGYKRYILPKKIEHDAYKF